MGGGQDKSLRRSGNQGMASGLVNNPLMDPVKDINK